jgi:hypothetical protein
MKNKGVAAEFFFPSFVVREEKIFFEKKAKKHLQSINFFRESCVLSKLCKRSTTNNREYL